MLPVRFCNYNLDYQQRLGFLKLLVWIGRGVRGGKEELLRKIESACRWPAVGTKSLRRPSGPGRIPQRPSSAVHLKEGFEPDSLIRLDAVPSWQVGFSSQRLDRLVLWAEMSGLIAANGRLSEWSTALLDQLPRTAQPVFSSNPFLLSERDRAFFLALLTYHDHVLLHLISSLSRLDVGTFIDARRACIEVMEALGRTLDRASGSTNIQAVRARQSLRDLLERLAGAEKVAHKGALLNPDERTKVLLEISASKRRNHLAEYHAVCRLEQLTDLGLLVKENPSSVPKTVADRYKARTTWAWYIPDSLKVVGELVKASSDDVETYLLTRWAESSLMGRNNLRLLDASRDQLKIAEHLDGALPRATRQLGAVQVHTWVFIAALDAIEKGSALEFSTAYAILDAARKDPHYAPYIRQSGQQTYLGRTASILDGSMRDYVSRYPLKLT